MTRRTALIAGVCYLVAIAQGIFDHILVGSKLLAPGNAALTARNILAHESVYRLAFTLDLIPAYAVVTMVFYQVFRPARPGASLLAAIFSLLGAAVGLTASVFQFAPVSLLSARPAAIGLGNSEIEALALVFLNLREIAFTISLLFFRSYCFLIGRLIDCSRFLPRTVGLLMMSGGLAYSVYSVSYFCAPEAGRLLGPVALSLGSLAEVALTIWLLLFGWSGPRTGKPSPSL